MLFIQLTGLSGSGKSTIAEGVKKLFLANGIKIEIIDADIFRPILCKDLGFSKADRQENIRRLGFVANLLAKNGVITILAAINPYEEIRQELKAYGTHVKTVWINCELETLFERDTKQLYKRALLADDHKDKVKNLTGVNDPYEPPLHPDLIIYTDKETKEESINRLFDFISDAIKSPDFNTTS
jgi:adenylylsulfate kinase